MHPIPCAILAFDQRQANRVSLALLKDFRDQQRTGHKMPLADGGSVARKVNNQDFQASIRE